MRALLVSLLAAAPLLAHGGSPDVFFEGDAGPVPPARHHTAAEVVPGVAEIEIRCAAPDVTAVRILPLRLVRGRQYAPLPDVAKRLPDDPQLFTGSLWLVASGSWQVRIDVGGARGPGRTGAPFRRLPPDSSVCRRASGWCCSQSDSSPS
jgi:hypothetical protein